jgi:RNA polymerase sigma-70 factor (ECF subfamily)
MPPPETVALPGAKWDAACVEESSPYRVVLECYDHEGVALERYLRLLGVEIEACGDIVQEAFLRLYEHLIEGGDATHPRAWLYRVSHNLAHNRRGAAHSRKTGPLPSTVDPIAPLASPEQMVMDRELDSRLRKAIDDLNPSQRECIVLRAQGFKYREIADVLELSTSTVAEIVQRAIGVLRKAV